MTKKKRKNKQDATLRNVRAAKKRTKTLEQRVKKLEIYVAHLLKYTHC